MYNTFIGPSLDDQGESWLSLLLLWHNDSVPAGQSFQKSVEENSWPQVEPLYSLAIKAGFMSYKKGIYKTTKMGMEWFLRRREERLEFCTDTAA